MNDHRVPAEEHFPPVGEVPEEGALRQPRALGDLKAPGALFHTPDGISDEVAAALPVAGLTAAAALEAVGLRSGDTVLVGGAAGGVGVFVVQLAKLAGAAVIGTASQGTFEFLRQLGAEPWRAARGSRAGCGRWLPTA